MFLSRLPGSSTRAHTSVADEAQVEIAIFAAGFSHLPDFMPGFRLGFVAGAIFDAIPFGEEGGHLQVIEDGLAEGVDAAEQWVGAIRVGGDNSVQHHPFAALAEIIFKFDNQ